MKQEEGTRKQNHENVYDACCPDTKTRRVEASLPSELESVETRTCLLTTAMIKKCV
jgi:hypothetical protein